MTTATEKDFQAHVIVLLKARGWKYIHHWRSDHSGAGWPDLFCVRGDRLLALEIKRENSRTTSAQDAWLDALENTGKIECHVVYPSGWDALGELLA